MGSCALYLKNETEKRGFRSSVVCFTDCLSAFLLWFHSVDAFGDLLCPEEDGVALRAALGFAEPEEELGAIGRWHVASIVLKVGLALQQRQISHLEIRRRQRSGHSGDVATQRDSEKSESETHRECEYSKEGTGKWQPVGLVPLYQWR